MDENDVVNMKRYNLYFVDDLESGRMHQISEYAQRLYTEKHTFKQRIKSGIKLALYGELDSKNAILNILAKSLILINIWSAWKKSKKDIIGVNIGFLIVEAMLMIYLGMAGRLPTRVGTSLFLIELSSAGAVFHWEQSEIWGQEKSLSHRWIVGIMEMILILIMGFQVSELQASQKDVTDAAAQYAVTEQYFEEHPQNTYFIPVEFTGGYREVFHVRKEIRQKNSFELGGWLNYSPVCEMGLVRRGIKDNPARAMLTQNAVYLILVAPSSKIEAYYQKHNKNIEWIQRDTAPIFYSEIPVFQIMEGEL